MYCNHLLGTSYDYTNNSNYNRLQIINLEWLAQATKKVWTEIHSPKVGCAHQVNVNFTNVDSKRIATVALVYEVVGYLRMFMNTSYYVKCKLSATYPTISVGKITCTVSGTRHCTGIQTNYSGTCSTCSPTCDNCTKENCYNCECVCFCACECGKACNPCNLTSQCFTPSTPSFNSTAEKSGQITGTVYECKAATTGNVNCGITRKNECECYSAQCKTCNTCANCCTECECPQNPSGPPSGPGECPCWFC